MADFRAQMRYRRFFIFREWKIMLMFLILAAGIFGLYYNLSNGIWNAQQNPAEILYGEVLSNRAEPIFDDGTQPIFVIRLELEKYGTVSLRKKGMGASNCRSGDRIQVRVLTSDSNRKFYQLGSQGCTRRSDP